MQSGVPGPDRAGGPRPQLDLVQVVERDQADAQGVVRVVRVVGQAVTRIDDLGFQQRAARRRRNSPHSGSVRRPLCWTNASRNSHDRFSPGNSG